MSGSSQAGSTPEHRGDHVGDGGPSTSIATVSVGGQRFGTGTGTGGGGASPRRAGRRIGAVPAVTGRCGGAAGRRHATPPSSSAPVSSVVRPPRSARACGHPGRAGTAAQAPWVEAGERIVGLLSDAGAVRRFGRGQAVDENAVRLDNGSPSTAIWCWPPPGHPAVRAGRHAGLTTHTAGSWSMSTSHSALNVLAAGDVLGVEPTAGRRIVSMATRHQSDRGHHAAALRRCGTAFPASGRRSAMPP